MSESPKNPTPQRRSGRDPLNDLSAERIDDLLAETESLASRVAEQIGVDSSASSASSGDAAQPQHAGDEAVCADRDIDVKTAELDAVQQALSVPPRPAEPNLTEPSSAADAGALSAADEVPVAVSAPPPPEAAIPGPRPPEPPPEPCPDAASTIEAVDAELAARAEERRLRFHPTRLLYAPVRAVGLLLVTMDLPFAWMGSGIKNAIGYVGIATLIMSAVIWVIVYQRSHG